MSGGAPQTGAIRGGERYWFVNAGIGYELAVPDIGVYFSLTRVRHDHHETIGLLTVRVTFRGAQVIQDGGAQPLLSSADFNCSSLTARKQRAKHLEEVSKQPELAWALLLEELCVRVLAAEEDGEDELVLQDVPNNPESFVEFRAAELPLLRRHPTIWFGDGGSAKSYFALWAAIDLVQNGDRVLYLDWEFAVDEHRNRFERLTSPSPYCKHLYYRRQQRPLCRDVERIRQIIKRQKITFLICDSMGFAADGTPESAEAATNYYRALRELGQIGSLHLAHISKAEQGEQKPFGSVFWSNGARNIWFLKRDESTIGTNTVPVGFFHRKSNVGRLQNSFAMICDFYETETRIRRGDITEFTSLTEKFSSSEKLASMPARIVTALREHGGVVERKELEEAVGVNAKNTGTFRKALSDVIGKGAVVEVVERMSYMASKEDIMH